MAELGATVTVRGTRYRVIGQRSTSGSGAKFYGKSVFTLRDDDGKLYEVYGKVVAHNSRIREVQGHGR